MGETGFARVLEFPVPGGAPAGPRRLAVMPVEISGEDARLERQEFERSEIAKILAGETDRFEYFVRTYQKRIFRLAYTLLRDPAEADGLTQDVFVKAYRGLADFKGDAAFETWATRIAINAVRDLVRRKKPVVSFGDLRGDGEEDGPELPARFDPADGTSPERDLMAREIRRRIADALVTLSPRQRAVFVMKHYEERSIAEIGAATGLDEGTIKSHLFRAARKLRERLE
ncbi:MAG TPA: sigma-70 family RNA polymerase sigma factor, partial [Thermoanaerobaculia bacterium]|nr:sigma-70 family RNA polymerase sigma factor [Thermoanaerobaculia bacterium]